MKTVRINTVIRKNGTGYLCTANGISFFISKDEIGSKDVPKDPKPGDFIDENLAHKKYRTLMKNIRNTLLRKY